MLIRKPRSNEIRPSEITPRHVFENRRQFMTGVGMVGLGAIAGGSLGGLLAPETASAATTLATIKNDKYTLAGLGEAAPTDKVVASTYNNFYEFGTGKGDPADNSKDFQPLPWTVTVDGAVENPGTYDFDDLINPHQLEERVYRFRCVEAWSMVVPWVGISLGEVIRRLGPTSNAKYVAFETLYDPERMPGQNRSPIPWPYVEGLRMDEAMHDLSLLTVGMYGEVLPNQNGAPIRLIVPWKYGFKSIKSIVRISFVEDQPPCTWNIANAREYGFYSNVNPEVDHPRWSQAKERIVGTGIFAERRKTEMLNGYADQVGSLYDGMDMSKYY